MRRSNVIAILEDDEGCQFVYKQILQDYELHFFEAISEFKIFIENRNQNNPMIIIADLQLKDGNFSQYINNNTQVLNEYPFIIVSSDDDIKTFNLCFSKGVKDYITKPFKKNELLFKVKRLLSVEIHKENIKYGVLLDGNNLTDLTKTETLILEYLIEKGRVDIPKVEIVEYIWKGRVVHQKTFDVHMYNLRRKLSKENYIIHFNKINKTWSLLNQIKGDNNTIPNVSRI